MIKLSIITVNYNNVAGLQKTIMSVQNQIFKDFEHIIIDGGSSDGGVDLIKKHEKRISYWISETDRGIYHAMNKGIEKAKGEYLLMLNSGDYLQDNLVLETVFNKSNLSDIIYGNVLWDDNGEKYLETFPNVLTFGFLRSGFLSHQAAFIRRKLHGLVGLYDEKYRIISDQKFFLLAICKYNVSYEHLPLAISICDRNGISCKPENFKLIHTEKKNVIAEEFPAFIQDYIKLDENINKYNFSKHILVVRIREKVKKWLNY